MSIQIPSSAKNWLTAALDPYHDTALELDGMPDQTTGRSYVRLHNSAYTISPTADGDNIAILFSGLHGPDQDIRVCRNAAIDHANSSIRSAVVLRAPAGVEPSMGNVYAGSAFHLYRVGTAFDADIPSRLIGYAIEVHDVSAPLYKRGTCTVVHATGGFQHIDDVRNMTDGTTDRMGERQDSTPALPTTLGMMQSFPNVYTGSVAKGCYVIARMSKAKHPVRFTGSLGHEFPHAFSWNHASSTVPSSITRDIRGADSFADLRTRLGMVSSGFQPFAIRLSGLPAEGEYRVTFRALVEYFPEADNPSALGISTPSPPMCQEVMEIYQRTISVMPSAVPVGNNASGDYWRQIRGYLIKIAPTVLSGASIALNAVGQPGAALAAKIAADVTRQLSQKSVPKKVPAKSLKIKAKRK